MESTPQRKSWLPIVETGCCCCTLRTCCVVQGIFILISCAINVGKAINDLIQAAACQALEARGETCVVEEQQGLPEDATVGFAITNITLEVIMLITAVLFLWAIVKEEPRKMLPYIWTLSFCIVSGLIMLIITAVILSPVVLIAAIVLALPIYMVICANSLRIKMEDCKDGQNFNSMNAMRSTTVA